MVGAFLARTQKTQGKVVGQQYSHTSSSTKNHNFLELMLEVNQGLHKLAPDGDISNGLQQVGQQQIVVQIGAITFPLVLFWLLVHVKSTRVKKCVDTILHYFCWKLLFKLLLLRKWFMHVYGGLLYCGMLKFISVSFSKR